MVRLKPVSEIKEQINILDNELYGVFPNPEYLKGMIMGLADAISYNCDKPNCIDDIVWENAKKSCASKLSDMKLKNDKIKKVEDLIKDILN